MRDIYLKMLSRYIMQGEVEGDTKLSEVMSMIVTIKQMGDIFRTSNMSVMFKKKEVLQSQLIGLGGTV
jgi:hypothetical protein